MVGVQEVCCGGRRGYGKGKCRGKKVIKSGEVLIFGSGVRYGSHGYSRTLLCIRVDYILLLKL